MNRRLYLWAMTLFSLQLFAQPRAEFELTTKDFGTVVEGTVCKYTFKLKNTGNRPLIISNVSVTCGCTVPRWSHTPIAAGDTSSVYVEFNTFNKMGNVAKGINLTTNAEEPMIGLIVMANIIPDPDFVVQTDSVTYAPLFLINQKSFYQIKVPAAKLRSRGYKDNGYNLEKIARAIILKKNKTLGENIWYTTNSEELIVNSFSMETRNEIAKILRPELRKKRKLKNWAKQIKD